jgi:NOL1/NOP2/fmu family ribosome biogenesis protein
MEKLSVTSYFHTSVKGEGLFITVLQKTTSPEKVYSSFKKQNKIFQPAPSPVDEFIQDSKEYLLQKKGDEFLIITAAAESAAMQVLQQLPRAELIGNIIEQKGKDFIPSHFLSMSGIVHASRSLVTMELNEALNYLERQTPVVNQILEKGWHLVSFHGTTLGWLKLTPQGWKNYYPMHWRLRNRK